MPMVSASPAAQVQLVLGDDYRAVLDHAVNGILQVSIIGLGW